MTHSVIGYPSLKATPGLVEAMARGGADFVELQIPFSDPVADGPTIMRANQAALDGGVRVRDCLTVMTRLSERLEIPLLFMGYYNTIFNYGVEAFCRDARVAGAAGLIVPDIPLDEEPDEGFIAACNKHDLHHIRVISPASTEARLNANANVANGFVYCVSRYGITGARTQLNPRLQAYLTQVRSYFDLPLAVGFGISNRAHIEALRGHAEIAVVGSAIIDLIEAQAQAEATGEWENVESWIQKLRP